MITQQWPFCSGGKSPALLTIHLTTYPPDSFASRMPCSQPFTCLNGWPDLYASCKSYSVGPFQLAGPIKPKRNRPSIPTHCPSIALSPWASLPQVRLKGICTVYACLRLPRILPSTPRTRERHCCKRPSGIEWGPPCSQWGECRLQLNWKGGITWRKSCHDRRCAGCTNGWSACKYLQVIGYYGIVRWWSLEVVQRNMFVDGRWSASTQVAEPGILVFPLFYIHSSWRVVLLLPSFRFSLALDDQPIATFHLIKALTLLNAPRGIPFGNGFFAIRYLIGIIPRHRVPLNAYVCYYNICLFVGELMNTAFSLCPKYTFSFC